MNQEFDELSLAEHLEPETSLSTYQEKWKKIVCSTKPIDRQKAADAVKTGYNYIGVSIEPEIIFCDSYYTALKIVLTELKDYLRKPLASSLIKKLNCSTLEFYHWGYDYYYQLLHELEKELGTHFNRYKHKINTETIEPIQPQIWWSYAGMADFDISVLKDTFEQRERAIHLAIFKHCGWVFPFENICIICERPCKISFDNRRGLHAEGEPALQFVDGYKLYSFYGTTIPEKYGKLHPRDWQAEWLLEETNAELRRVLIEGIGYTRIMEELDAVEIDSYNEYSLIEVINNIDIEPIHLLEMTCPSTGKTHVLRVPPNLKSAREAIKWINWDVDPERFAIQT